MTIHLPENLERPILAAVQGGRYASVEDAMAEAAILLVERLERERAASAEPVATAGKSIWEVLDDLRKDVPPEEFAKLPKDGAEQLDHYLHGSPKRPTS